LALEYPAELVTRFVVVGINALLPLVLALAGADQPAGAVELRGRVVCIDPSGAPRPCETTGNRFALQASESELHVFLASDRLTAMFEDDAVRTRALAVRARATPSGEIETIKVYSVREGRLHDLDYFCEVCNIVAYAPGACVCCRQPLVLRERPLSHPPPVQPPHEPHLHGDSHDGR
jgi:hypothetical protein